MPRRRRTSSLQIVLSFVVIVIAAILFLTGQFKTPEQTASVPINPPAGGANLTWVTAYFTDPNPPDNIGHGIDQIVQSAIDGAATSIDVTSFDLNLPSLINALGSASKRGVKVRVVYDGTNGSLDLDNALTNDKTFSSIPVLKTAGVGLVDGGRSNGLMHDKMVIVDGKTLFMGSWNLSYNDTYRNNNNLLKITDPQIIANYQAKFNDLYAAKKFGTHAVVKALAPVMTIGGTPVENYFSPPDGVMDKLIQYVQGAKKSVHYIIFTYTDENLAAAMIARAKAGVDVQGVIENRGASQGALVSLFCAKMPVRTDGNKYTMHHKVIIIDSEFVITGSFNFTKSADDSNDDNILVIHNSALAAQFEQEYKRVKGIAEVPQAADIKCGK
jgi:phosphatidylserine/phosphatidylglycerophosphate/cardiolipin synthase-like enzyme